MRVPSDQPPSGCSSAACIDAHSPWLTLLTCTATCGSSTLHACLSEDVLNELVRQSNHRDHWRASKCNGRVWFHFFFIVSVTFRPTFWQLLRVFAQHHNAGCRERRRKTMSEVGKMH